MNAHLRIVIAAAVCALAVVVVNGWAADSGAHADSERESDGRIRILLLSGANNHDWRTTTPRIKRILEDTGRFSVDVLEQTHAITAKLLADYGAIVSDFNTFTARYKPPRDPGWSDETKQAYIEFVRRGGGHVVVHAGSSSFYDWPEYQELVISSFSVGRTDHGVRHDFPVRIDVADHPITEGMTAFRTFDELWHEAPVSEGATVLASAFSSKESRGSGHYEPVAMVSEPGNGRSFTLLLGHYTQAMDNVAFQTLLARGTEWAATGTVTLPVSCDWPGVGVDELPTMEDPLRWRWGESMLALVDTEKVIWQFNCGEDASKPHFHPLALSGGSPLTWQAPPDHPWHHGLWFSWKLINGVNYWEEDRATGRAKGRTEWSGLRIGTEEDHSARIEMELAYREAEGETAPLTEQRVIEVSRPEPDGSYHIDWTMTFTAAQDVLLDRTPLPGEPGGKVFGGYAGLSMRFASQFEDRRIVSTSGTVTFKDDRHRSRGIAVDYSGIVDGERAGIAILDHPKNLNAPSPWYVIKGPVMSFFSPAVICAGPHRLAAGESMTLRYRVIVHAGQWDEERLSSESERFVGEPHDRMEDRP